MDQKDYYTAPPQEVFDDIKQAAMAIWNTYSDPYKAEKLNRIRDVQNVKDNAWFLVAMFDHPNQQRLLELVRPETAELIMDARGY
jgi:hypothetical protein